MSLTGVPLIVCSVLVTGAALTATVLVWSRWARLRFLLRPAGVLLTEALLVLSVGLIVNRSQGFYPSWAALTESTGSTGTTYAVRAGGLDGSLHDNGGDSFTWQPGGLAEWRLAGPPLVITPAGYLTHTAWRYPAVLVVDDGKNGWTPASETTAARDADAAAGPAIVVFARTTAATSAGTLESLLPDALGHDLRVTDRRWALVGPAADAGLTDRIVSAAAARYPVLGLVAARTKPRSTAAKKPAVRKSTLPAGIETADQSTLIAALTWADRQTPPPLAASTPAATSLPVYHHHPHRSPTPAPGTSPAPPLANPGGRHVAR